GRAATRRRGGGRSVVLAARRGASGPPRRHIAEARACYASAHYPAGEVRVLEKEAGLLRDSGSFEEALTRADERIRQSVAMSRIDLRAAARHDRGDLLAALGRWRGARGELEQATAPHRRVGHPREGQPAGGR